MSRDMSFFMKGKAAQVKEEEVPISNRYIDEKGKVIPFVLKPVDSVSAEELEKECTKTITKKGKPVSEKLDKARYLGRLGVESTVFPNLKDAALLKSYGCVDSVELAHQLLPIPGEYSKWISEVARINGFDEDFDELVDEAKN